MDKARKWKVIYKIESFGHVYIAGKDKAEVCENFLKIQVTTLLKDAQVERPNILGMLKPEDYR